MRQFLIILFVFASACSKRQFNADRYRAEVYSFMDQVLHDTTRYTLEDYLTDSLRKRHNSNPEDRFMLDYRTYQPDTCNGVIRIHLPEYSMCFNNFIFITDVGSSFKYIQADDSGLKSIYTYTAACYKQDSSFFKAFKWPNNFHHFRTATGNEINSLFSSVEHGWEQFDKQYRADGFLKVSLPYFNKKFDEAIFSYSYSCGGLCGQGYFFHYKKVNGRWKCISGRMTWVS